MLLQDLRYAVRGLVRRPGFATITIVTLSVGIGANAAIFAAVNAVLLRPLPFAEPDRLVQVFKLPIESPDGQCCVTSPPDFVDWRRDSSVFTELAAVNEGAYPLAGDGPAEQVPGATVTGGFFDVLGVRAVLGRTLETADDAIGAPDVVVLGAGLWRRRFGADRGIAALDGGAVIPLLDQTRIDANVLLFTFVTSLVTLLLFGLMPAWRASAIRDVAQRMRKEGTNTTGDVSSQHWRAALIVVQTALAVILLIGAGLLVRSFSRLLAVDPGFAIDHIQTFTITLPGTRYISPPQRASFVEDLVSRIGQRPDVVAAGAAFGLPFEGFDYGISTRTVDGRQLTDDEHDRLTFEVRLVTPDYFRLMGMSLLRGRGVMATDRLGTEHVAILSESAAKMMWPDRDPLGHHFTLGTRMGQGGVNAGGTVVGIARDIHDLQPGRPPRPTVYLPYAQFPVDYVAIAVRARGEPSRLIEPMRKLLADLDSNIPMFQVRTMEQLGAEALSKPRLYTMLLSAFAIVAVFLSALGLYGMLTHLVSQRTREIAVRIALGAERRAVVGLVVGRAGWLAACGVAIGCAVAVMASRFLRGMLFSVSATDAPTYACVAVGAFAIAILASWLPARRAARIQPVTALRLD